MKRLEIILFCLLSLAACSQRPAVVADLRPALSHTSPLAACALPPPSETAPEPSPLKAKVKALRKIMQKYDALNPWEDSYETIEAAQAEMCRLLQEIFTDPACHQIQPADLAFPHRSEHAAFTLRFIPPLLRVSDDGDFWVFTWDEKGGGSGQYFHTFLHYRGRGRTLLLDLGGMEHGEMPYTVYGLYAHPGDNAGNPVYLLEMGDESGGAGNYTVGLVPCLITEAGIRICTGTEYWQQQGDRYDPVRGCIRRTQVWDAARGEMRVDTSCTPVKIHPE